MSKVKEKEKVKNMLDKIWLRYGLILLNILIFTDIRDILVTEFPGEIPVYINIRVVRKWDIISISRSALQNKKISRGGQTAYSLKF